LPLFWCFRVGSNTKITPSSAGGNDVLRRNGDGWLIARRELILDRMCYWPKILAFCFDEGRDMIELIAVKVGAKLSLIGDITAEVIENRRRMGEQCA